MLAGCLEVAVPRSRLIFDSSALSISAFANIGFSVINSPLSLVFCNMKTRVERNISIKLSALFSKVTEVPRDPVDEPAIFFLGDVGNGGHQACEKPMNIGPLKTRVPSLCVK